MRIMKKHNIKADYRRLKEKKRVQEQETYEAQNTLNRQFEQAAANQVWVTDRTSAYNICNWILQGSNTLTSWIITPTETSTGLLKYFKWPSRS
ncbi:hypothetical protein ACW2AE_00685 [Limosilactobacillus fermentum]